MRPVAAFGLGDAPAGAATAEFQPGHPHEYEERLSLVPFLVRRRVHLIDLIVVVVAGLGRGLVEADLGLRPGFSGGALIDAQGNALGMNTALGRHGPAITLPVETLRRIVPDLLSGGRVPRGYLGVGAYPVRVAAGSPSAGEAALIIVSVEAGGPAAKAGVQQGDVLVSIDGERTSSLGTLKGVLDAGRAGRPARLSIVRAGQLHDVDISLGTA